MTNTRRFLRAAAAAAALAPALLAAACSPSQPPAPAAAPSAGVVLRYRMPEDPPNLDPFQAGDDNSLVYVHPVFDGLVEYVPGTVEVRPAVAESWAVSPDGLTYTFKLRHGVRFHNGRAVEAADVVYSIRRALSRSARSEKRSFLAALKGADAFWENRTTDLPGVAAPDPGTVVFTLDYPYGKFLTILAGEAGSILPKEVYDDPGKAYLRHPVGCGPFRFESWEPKVSLTLARFEDHWKGPAPPGAIGRIVFRFIFDSATAMEEYRTGGLDFTQEIPPGQRQKVMQEMAADFHTWTRFSILYVGFNHAAAPLKDNPLLRRAISHAIDRDFIVRVLQEGKDTVASGVIPPGMVGHDPDRAPPAYDPELASRLLAEAGYPKGQGLPELVYRSNDTRGFRLIAERVQSDLSRIGVRMKIEMSDFGAFLASMQSGKAAASAGALYRMTWFADWPDPDSFLAAQFETGAPGNFGLYHNPAFDEMMRLARREPDANKRAGMYQRADTMLMEDAGLVPIYWYGQDVLMKPVFTGLKACPLGVFGIAWEEVTHRP